MAKRDSPTPAATPKPAKVAVSDAADRELAASALEKRRRNEMPTARELAALRRIEKQREEELRWAHYRTIPQKHWREMSGRQAKVLAEQADRHGIPFGGAVVDLPKVIRAFHDFLAENKHVLAREDDPALYGPDSPSLERLRAANADLKELELGERRQELIQRDVVHDGFVTIAGVLRRAGDLLQRRFGREAMEILNEALTDCEAVIAAWSQQGDSSTDNEAKPAGRS